MEEQLLMCPNCNAIWGMEEIDEQYCGACGYPDPDEEDVLFDNPYRDYYED
jgi:Zn ribbon nucleic-acid-binding protein